MDNKYITDISSYITKESILEVVNSKYIQGDIFGQIILDALGYNASCIGLYRNRQYPEDAINIAWNTPNGEEYIHTFFIDEEILPRLEGKILTLEFSVERK